MVTETRRYYFRVVGPSAPSEFPVIIRVEGTSLYDGLMQAAKLGDTPIEELEFLGHESPELEFLAARERQCSECGLRGERLVPGLRPDMSGGLCVDCAGLHIQREEKRFYNWATAVGDLLHETEVCAPWRTLPEGQKEIKDLLDKAILVKAKELVDGGHYTVEEAEAAQAG